MPQLQRSPVVPLLILAVVAVAAGGFLAWAQTVPGPSVEFADPPQSIGRSAEFHLTATARRGGVRWIERDLVHGRAMARQRERNRHVGFPQHDRAREIRDGRVSVGLLGEGERGQI